MDSKTLETIRSEFRKNVKPEPISSEGADDVILEEPSEGSSYYNIYKFYKDHQALFWIEDEIVMAIDQKHLGGAAPQSLLERLGAVGPAVPAAQDDDLSNNSASVDVNAVVIINDKISAQTLFIFWNLDLKQFSFDLKLTNESTDTLCAPVYVEFDTIFTLPPNPNNITVDNADGGGTGIGAFFDYSDSLGGDHRLDPGEMSKLKTWRFNDPDSINFFFTANVFGIVKPGPVSPAAKTTGAKPEPLRFYVDVKNSRVEQITGTTDVEEPTPEEEIHIPTEFALQQNYPNPFNPETVIRYQLPRESQVKLSIHNLLGQEIRSLVNERKDVGHYDVIWNGRDNAGQQVASGVYIYRIRAGNFTKVKKLMLLR